MVAIIFEFLVVVLIIAGLFNEKKLIAFENRVIRFFKIFFKVLRKNSKVK